MSIVILTYNSNYVDYFPYHYHNHCYMLHVNSTLSLFEISHTNRLVERHRTKSPGTGFETFRGLASSTSEAHQPRLVFGPPTKVPGIGLVFQKPNLGR